MPGLMYVVRKPTPLGREMHTTTCAESRVICFAERYEGKHVMAKALGGAQRGPGGGGHLDGDEGVVEGVHARQHFRQRPRPPRVHSCGFGNGWRRRIGRAAAHSGHILILLPLQVHFRGRMRTWARATLGCYVSSGGASENFRNFSENGKIFGRP
eukprot:872158-Prorocentrum_minimum.AAC.1